MNPLPGHLGDMAPPLAERAERCRRRALDWLFAHSYRLFAPPLAEHLQALTAGDKTLDVDTFKMTDTLSGETLGLRADHTPQVLRFDRAARAENGNDGNDGVDNDDNRDGVRRYCYCGSVIRAHPPQPWKFREEIQIGAEIFGAPAPGGEMEIARAARGMLAAAGVGDLCVSLAHAGIVRALAAEMPEETRDEVLRRFSLRDADGVLAAAADDGNGKTLAKLCGIAGGEESLAEARAFLPPECQPALDELAFLRRELAREGGDAEVDFSDIGGYGYHTGAVFVFYAGGYVAARGGRYDRGESAVGFSVNLREIAEHLPPETRAAAVACPLAPDDEQWQQAVADLEKSGRRLRFVHNSEESPPPRLQKTKTGWRIQES